MLTQIKRNCTVNIKSNKLMSCLSLSTMTLLIISSIVVITIINVTPIVILGLAQLQYGQRDLILQPRLQFMNTTKIRQYTHEQILPRLQMLVFVNGAQAANGWFMDFTLERQMHLGTIAGFQGQNHNYVYANSDLQLQAGQKTTVGLLDKSFIIAMKKSIQDKKLYAQNSQSVVAQLLKLINDPLLIKGNFIVKDNFDTSSGKFGIGQISKFIYLDIKYAFKQMIQDTYVSLGKNLNESALIKFLNSPYFNLGDFASEATVNLPNRVDVYSDPDYDKTHTYLGHFGQSFMKKIGIFSVETRMPIAQHLIQLGYVGMFIGVTLKLIIVSLFTLSVIMMNNMLSMGVERKNFDFALLKVMGADRIFIVINLLTNSLKYVLLANFIAYPIAYMVLQSVTEVFESFFGYKYNMSPTFSSLIGGLIIGVLVPIISALAPIWGVINNDLVQNLNPIRNKTLAITTQVYIQGKQFPFGKLAFGVLATTYGLMIYYLLPKSLINQNIGLLLIIFFIILAGLLLGLIFFSYSFQYLLEMVIAYMTLFWINKTDFILTLKNLSSHRFKNRRSSILYALSVSFIIFVSVGLQIQLQTIYNQLLKYRGSYIQILSNSDSIDPQLYNNKLSTIPGILDWAYISAPLDSIMQNEGVKQIMISDKAKLFFASNQIFAVSPNLVNTFFFDRVSVYKTDSQYPYDPYSYLYSQQGYMTCTLSKYIAQRFGIIDSENHQFYINYYYENKVRRTVLNYSSIFDKRIGLLYGSITPRSQIGVSFDTFKTLSNLPSIKDIPIRRIKLKISDPSKSSEIANRIRATTPNQAKVWQYSELRDTILKIENIINTVITILLVVVLIISFFSLITTTYVNVLNQTNQIGILMILGYERFRIVKIFIYECFVLVVSSCIIGVIVGFIVAWMMGLQRQLFTDLPVSIEVKGLDIIIVAAILSSILSTYKPLQEVFNNSISQIMNYAK